jgi:hypothetical protein
MKSAIANEPQHRAMSFGEEEVPTQRSGVNLIDYAREAEALLAGGLDINAAQMLRPTIRPSRGAAGASPSDPEEDISLDAAIRLVASHEEIEWFPLSDSTSAILRLVEGSVSVGEVLARAEIAPDEGRPLIRILVEFGLIAVR